MIRAAPHPFEEKEPRLLAELEACSRDGEALATAIRNRLRGSFDS